MDYDSFVYAVSMVVSYNCLGEYVLKWIDIDHGDLLVAPDNYGFKNCKDWPYHQLQAIWMITVSLFGDWGTSPRFGWIDRDKLDAYKKWILDITESWREDEDYNGPEEYRIDREVYWFENGVRKAGKMSDFVKKVKK